MKNKDLKFIYFGTPEFAKLTLQGLLKSGYKPDLVVTAPDRPTGRKQELSPSPVKVLAEKENILLLQPEKIDESTIEKLKKINADIFIVAAYGKILPESVLKIPQKGSLNLHPSLLPKYRGPSPIQHAILKGDKKTGTSIIVMDEKMDHGPLLAQESINIKDNATYEDLGNDLFNLGTKLLVEVLPKYIKGEIKPTEQNHAQATYTHIITRDDGKIDWNIPAKSILNKLRAFDPWPGIFTFITFKKASEESVSEDIKRLKILSAKIDTTQDQETGVVIEYKNSFAITADRSVLIPTTVQLEGKQPQDASDFLKSYPSILGMRLL